MFSFLGPDKTFAATFATFLFHVSCPTDGKDGGIMLYASRAGKGFFQ